jgi:hypothetical protein
VRGIFDTTFRKRNVSICSIEAVRERVWITCLRTEDEGECRLCTLDHPLHWRYSPGGFVTVSFSGLGYSPTPNPQTWRTRDYVWPLFFDLSGMGGAARSLRSRQHSSPGHWDAQTSSPRKGGSPLGHLHKIHRFRTRDILVIHFLCFTFALLRFISLLLLFASI